MFVRFSFYFSAPNIQNNQDMRRIITTAACLALTAGLSAQSGSQEPINQKLQDANAPTSTVFVPENAEFTSFTRGGGNGNSTEALGDTILYESFGDGFNGDPGNGAWTNTGTNNADWEYRGPGTMPNSNTGSRGAFSGGNPSNPIGSLTPANGFIIFDSDWLDNGGDDQNMGGGVSPTPHIGIIESPSMDLSGINSARISFNSFFRRFQGTAVMEFSTDGGNNWGNRTTIFGSTFPLNASTPNGIRLGAFIPLAVMDNSDVKVRFIFDGQTESNANGSGYYFWMLDDILITEGADDNIDLRSIDMDPFLVLGDAPFDIAGELRNIGANTLTSYDLSYTVNGGTPVTETITGQNIAPYASENFVHPTQWNPTQPGSYEIVVYTENPNGVADEDPNSARDTITVEVVDDFVQRMPLYEIFTSSTCGPCRPGNENFHSITDSRKGEFVAIKYQQNFPGTGDPYSTDESVARRNFYSINSIPRMMIDGGWDQNAASFTAQLHEDSRSVPSFLDMELEYEFDEEEQTISYELNIDALQDFNNVLLHVAIVEEITFDNVKSNGETEFEQVMKKMMPDESGRSVSITESAGYSLSESFTFEGNYRLPPNANSPINHSSEHSVENFDDIYVIAWIQHPSTNEVFQAVQGTEKDNNSTSDIERNDNITLYPNPTNHNATLRIDANKAEKVSIRVYDAVGAEVMTLPDYNVQNGTNQIELQTGNLVSGYYHVAISSNGTRVVKPLIIKK